MQIGLVGTGNVAQVLARVLALKGHRLVQVLARDLVKAKALADMYGADAAYLSDKPDARADIFILTLSDAAYAEEGLTLRLQDKLLLHTSGFLSIEVLSRFSVRYGVLWPVQSLRKEISHLPELPFVIEANSEKDLIITRELANTLSDKVMVLGSHDRRKLHLSAVVANNFTNHLFTLAESFCKREGLDFQMLLPLIKETSSRLTEMSPANLQTGPAVRNDEETIRCHLEMLKEYSQLALLYQVFSESISNFSKSH